MKRVRTVGVLAIALTCVARPAPAQTLSELLSRLLTDGAVIAIPLDPYGTDLSQSFVGSVPLATVPSQLMSGLALQISDFPLGPTSGTLIFSRDGVGPEMHNAYGGAYAPRPFTIRRGKYGAALTFQNDDFMTLNGVDLRGNGVNFLFANRGPEPDTADVLDQAVSMRLNRKVTSFVFSYGVNDRFEVGAVLPIVQVAMDMRVQSRILRVRTSPNSVSCPGVINPQGSPLRLCQDPHGYDKVLTVATNDMYLGLQIVQEKTVDNNYGLSGLTKRGIGDVVLRGKYALVQGSKSAVAATIDLSMPTGNADNFLGTGAFRATPGIVVSTVAGRVSPHASVSYTSSHGKLSSLLQSTSPVPLDLTVPNEIGWSAGFDAAVAPRTTLVADFFGRTIRNVQTFGTSQTIFATGGPGVPADIAAGTALTVTGRGNISQSFGTIGGRFNLGGSVFANGSVMFPISVTGLKPRTGAVFSIDYGF